MARRRTALTELAAAAAMEAAEPRLGLRVPEKRSMRWPNKGEHHHLQAQANPSVHLFKLDMAGKMVLTVGAMAAAEQGRIGYGVWAELVGDGWLGVVVAAVLVEGIEPGRLDGGGNNGEVLAVEVGGNGEEEERTTTARFLLKIHCRSVVHLQPVCLFCRRGSPARGALKNYLGCLSGVGRRRCSARRARARPCSLSRSSPLKLMIPNINFP